MRGRLQDHYQVSKELGRNGCFEGGIALSKFTRLGDFLNLDSQKQTAYIDVEFEFVCNDLGDDFESSMLVGQIKAHLELECQRCLSTMEMPLELSFKLLIDASEEMIRGSGLDGITSDEGVINIVDLVEDEILLAVPLAPAHKDEACNQFWKTEKVESGAKENPFSVLKQLKTAD